MECQSNSPLLALSSPGSSLRPTSLFRLSDGTPQIIRENFNFIISATENATKV